MAICTIMNKTIYKSLILLICAMFMACQGDKDNAQSKKTESQQKSETSVCSSMTIFLLGKHRCWLMP